jgi:hypothetical protein
MEHDDESPAGLRRRIEAQKKDLDEYKQFFNDLTPLLEKLDKEPELAKAFLDERFNTYLATAIVEGRVLIKEREDTGGNADEDYSDDAEFSEEQEEDESLEDTLSREFVTSEDIEWWDSLGDEGKEEIFTMDRSFRIFFAMHQTKSEGLSPAEATAKVRKHFAIYDEYPRKKEMIEWEDAQGYSDEDRALPFQLHARIDKFLATFSADKAKLAQMQKEIAKDTSFNSWIRRLIKNGVV